ncbi:hypothetical protein LINPERPRIM_LOCUS13420 [Linum perenne]
MAWISRFA